MQILDSYWFNGNIGIVKTFDDFDGVKFYIGKGLGLDQKADEQHIADWGSTFPFDAGVALFGKIGV